MLRGVVVRGGLPDLFCVVLLHVLCCGLVAGHVGLWCGVQYSVVFSVAVLVFLCVGQPFILVLRAIKHCIADFSSRRGIFFFIFSFQSRVVVLWDVSEPCLVLCARAVFHPCVASY